jgi:hypothetical protein
MGDGFHVFRIDTELVAAGVVYLKADWYRSELPFIGELVGVHHPRWTGGYGIHGISMLWPTWARTFGTSPEPAPRRKEVDFAEQTDREI